MFRGYAGYVQADAKSVYDILFREPEDGADEDGDDGATRSEVGCWANARRKFYEAAIAKRMLLLLPRTLNEARAVTFYPAF